MRAAWAEMIPDAVVTEATKDFINSGGPLAFICVIEAIVIWWIDRRARQDAKEHKEELNAEKAAHLASVQKANDRFEDLAAQTEAVVMILRGRASI